MIMPLGRVVDIDVHATDVSPEEKQLIRESKIDEIIDIIEEDGEYIYSLGEAKRSVTIFNLSLDEVRNLSYEHKERVQVEVKMAK